MSHVQNKKPKIFVRYTMGASGLFVSTLLMSLVKPVELQDKHNFHGHNNTEDYFSHNNFLLQWTKYRQDFAHGLVDHRDIDQSISWVRERFFFTESPWPIYVIPTHATNVQPFLTAFDNTKLVNIVVQENELEQVGYNWIKKAVHRYEPNQEALTNFISSFRYKYPMKKIPQIDLDNLQDEDLKFLTYVYKFTVGQQIIQKYNKFALDISPDRIFNIDFADIASKKLLLYLKDVCEFLEISANNERIENAHNLIETYARAQIKVPWKFSIDDY